MPYKIFVTRDIPDEGIKMLRKLKNVTLDIYPGEKAISRKELLKKVKGADIVLSILTEKIDKEVFEAAGPQLKMIANYAVGFDNIDLKEAKKRKILVTNTPHQNVAETVAEHSIALMFALAHRITEADRFTRAGRYECWGPKMMLGTDLWKKTVGVIGAGRIGAAVLHRLHDGFGVKVIYNDLKKNPEFEKVTGAKFRTRDQVLKESDFISLHVPLCPATHHMISTREFKIMKPTAFIINTARGPVIDEKALLKALVNKEIAGAGLDVFECEPLIDCDPRDNLELRKMENVVLTPHTASATIEARQAMSRVAAENITAFIKGKNPPNLCIIK
ncbi:MAG: hypothetical protein UX09_C0032G0001 [Candidatus Uhrbacteria bacterium GW2011_GWE2_45_35]|uniref:D-glycerate dehydrogenase n=2 Tax=Candidatus Uhriibacteriota TaxID=1752732 RepID=A0A0G1JFH0_9BACT|nr:MAG: hypothetical protein UW63_C0026G0001 [Candidatus Uhrbacteria bacterium GW2011_GWF2_44_350]KKU07268.1 MAG: hypothetical protein UX09_C0032G0001 [Candidatus Uhrbacteria bacterium GW2011_GWE2_45_35]HBR80414.1 D-glycerate dehydrogenase [Candidatus Uhrbacteria bacterium]HCU31177.1 D-glycerate dehydrogenase [Candidatus Uhrbacteria bacterium]